MEQTTSHGIEANDGKHFAKVSRVTPYKIRFLAGEAIELLQKNKYDLVFLDHDLGDEIYVDSFGEKETGFTVAQWIAKNKPEIDTIIVHTLNPAGAKNIRWILRKEYNVMILPFIILKNYIGEILA